VFGGIESVSASQMVIHDDDIGLKLAKPSDRLIKTARGTNAPQIGFHVEGSSEQLRKGRVIVDDEYPNDFFVLSTASHG